MRKLANTLGVALILSLSGIAQERIQLPVEMDSILPMPVKLKGGAFIMRYSFGPYQLENVQGKWLGESLEETTPKSFLANFREMAESSKEHTSFQLTNGTGQQAAVAIAKTRVNNLRQYKEGLLGNRFHQLDLNSRHITWLAQVQVSTTKFQILAVQEEVEGVINVQKPLAVEVFCIENNLRLEKIDKFKSGKKAMIDLGFWLYENDKPIGAVQYGGKPSGYAVWLIRSSGEAQLAAAAMLTTIMAIAHDAQQGN